MTKPKVWNKRDPNVPKDAVYVGRPTKWGNPFVIGQLHHGVKLTRQLVVGEYENMLENPAMEPLIQEIKRELRGKDLVCWCAPYACHGDILLRIANEKISGED